MSKYTTEVRYICEAAAGLDKSVGFDEIDATIDAAIDKIFNFNFPTPSSELIDKAVPVIFNFSFPCFDESYRKVLCKKILMHYYTREICEETVGLWKLRLCTKLNEIMPYYNQLYRSAAIDFNPLYDIEYTKNIKRIKEEKGEKLGDNSERIENLNYGTQKGDTTNTITDRESDTPQGGLNGIYNDKYLTRANIREDDNIINSEYENNVKHNKNYRYEDLNNIDTTEDFLESIKGKMSGNTYSSMLMEYRKTFLNIDMMIIDELKDLFFNLW